MRRRAAALCAVILTLGAAPLLAPPSQATQAPVAFTSADLPTWQTNGVAWAVASAQGLVFVGGTFTSIRPPGAEPGTGELARNNFAVFDAATGAPTSCAPSFTLPSDPSNVTVRALAVSPNQSTLYIGGYFSNAGPLAQQHLAALDIQSCTVNAGFRPLPSGTVRAIAATASSVYFGGSLVSVGGTQRDRAAKVAAVGTPTPGALLPWSPSFDKDVRAIGVKPDESVVAVGGDITTSNGVASHSVAVVNSTSGANVKTFGANFVHVNSVTKDIAVDATGFYAANEGTGTGVFDGRFAINWDGYTERWRDTCLGATQAVVVYQGVLYSGSHAHDCTLMNEFPDGARNHFLAQSVDDPTLLPWFPNTNEGIGEQIGPRDMAVASSGSSNYLWGVGEFTTVNGKPQQGITRFGDGPDTVAPSTPSLSTTSFRNGQVRVAWRESLDTDDALLTYRLYRDGSTTPMRTETATSWFWQRDQMGITDTGLAPGSTHTYRVSVSDGVNTVLSAWRSVTVATTSSAYAERVVSDGADVLWRYDEPSDVLLADSIHDTNATIRGSTTYQVSPSALNNDPSRALTFLGGTSLAYTETRKPSPTTFSLETWFKTTTTVGGKLIGFGNKQTALSQSYDKHIYMSNNGRLNFGVFAGGYVALTTPTAYNDGNWHQVVGTQGPGGMALYVDGARVAKNGVTTNQNFDGYWHLGGDQISSAWPNYPSSLYWTGSLDETAIYPTALSASTVADHYTLSGRTLAAGAAGPADYYGRAQYDSDPQFYWRLGESGGTTAADASGNGLTGTYFSGVTYNQSGAVAGTTDKAVQLSGTSTGLVASTTALTAPSQYTAEAWFKTSTSTGGKILGFGSSRSGNSATQDRNVYMRNDGRLSFGVTAGSNVTLTSPGAYNNGAWHFVTATQGPSGMALYVDGVPVASNGTTGNSAYSGYWRAGGDTLSGWPSAPTSTYLAGTVDEVAVHTSASTAAQVAARYSAGNPAVTDKAAPTVPTGLGVGFTAGDAVLDWTASLDNVGVTGYDVYRSADPAFVPGPATLVGSSAGPAFTDSGVAPGTWFYRVVGKDAAGNRSTASNRTSVFVTDTVAPSVPTGVAVTTTANSANVTWNASTDAVGVTGYNVYRSTTAGFTPSPATLLTTVAGTSYLDAPLALGTWRYRIAAVDGSGNVSAPSAEVSGAVADATPPGAPTGLTTSVSGASVTVSWNAATDDVGVTGYDVYESSTSGFIPGPSTLIRSTSDLSIVSSVPTAGTWYYQVVAKDGSGNRGAASVEASAVVAAFTTSVTVSTIADTYANQAAATTNYGSTSSLTSRGSTDAVSYLRFAVPTAPPGTSLTGVNLRITTTSDSFAGSADSHQIRTASNSWNESTLNWNNRPALATGVGSMTSALAPNTTYQTSLAVAPISAWAGSQGTLAVSTTSTDSLWFWSANYPTAAQRPQLVLTYTPSDDVPPSVPAGLSAVVTPTTVALSWPASTDDTAVAGYDVYRGTSADFVPGPSNLVGVSSTPSFTNTSVPAGTAYYRVVARDVNGNRSDPSAPFTAVVPDTTAPTSPSAPDVTATSTSATLTWSAASDDVGVTEYAVYRSATSGFVPGPSTAIGTTAATHYVDSPLATGTWYYLVVARDLAGNAGPPSAQVTAVVVDTAAPSMPDELMASVGAETVTLTWAASGDDVGVTGYEVHRSTISGFVPGPSTLLTTTAVTNHLDSPVGPGTWYYVVVARDAAGNRSTPSTQLTVVTNDVSPPSSPTGVTAAVTGSEVDLTWTASIDNVGVATYDVHRSATSGFTPSASTLLGTVTGTTYLDSPVTAGTWYYVVIAADAADNRSAPSTQGTGVVVDPQPPTVPSALVSSVVDASVHLSWGASTDNVGVVAYDVHRSTASGFTPDSSNLISSPATTAYVDTPPPGTWYYRVVARDAADNRSAGSNEATATTADVTPPTAPDFPLATPAGDGLDLTWSASTDDVAVTGYEVHRSSASGFTPEAATLIGSVASPGFHDTPPSIGTWYYRVVALDAAGHRTASAQFSGEQPDRDAPSAPTNVLTLVASPSVTVSWTASSDDVGVSRYDVYRSGTAGFTPSPSTLIGSATDVSFLDPNAPAGTQYYRVVAVDAAANRSTTSDAATAVVLDTTAPSIPGTPSLSVGVSTVGLSWTAATDDVGVTGYEVHRSATNGFSPSASTLLTTVGTATYTNTSVPSGTWYYRVVALDAAGNRTASGQASAVVTSTPTVVTLTPTADTYANQGATTTNYGTTSSLAARTTGGLVSYLRFTIPAAPAGKTLVGAVLRVRTSTDPTAGTVDAPVVQRAADTWTESTLTWANRPAVTAGTVGTFPANSVTNAAYSATLDVPTVAPLVGSTTFAVTDPGADAFWFWSSNYANTAYRPQLVLTYG